MKLLPNLKLLLIPFLLLNILYLTNPIATFAQGNNCLPGLGNNTACPETPAPTNGGSSVQVGNINDKALGIPTDVNKIIGGLVQLVYAVGGIVFFFMLLLGGLRYLTAGGDEKAAAAARSTLTSAFIGLVIIAAAFVITQLLFSIFGIKGFISLG